MWYMSIACLFGVFGGFGSVSRGRFFQRTSGAIVLGTCFFAEFALSVAAGFSLGLWWGIGAFFLAWLVCGHIGSTLFNVIDRALREQHGKQDF